jgi:hypothetical protein
MNHHRLAAVCTISLKDDQISPVIHIHLFIDYSL